MELAGAVKEIATGALRNDFVSIDIADSRVVLVEGQRLLPAFPGLLSASASHQLERIGVEIQTDTVVTDVDSTGVDADDGRLIAATVLWAAGVKEHRHRRVRTSARPWRTRPPAPRSLQHRRTA